MGRAPASGYPRAAHVFAHSLRYSVVWRWRAMSSRMRGSQRADPPVGGVVSATAVPGELDVWFSEPVEPALSSVEVRAGDGARMDRGDLRGDAADRTRLRISLSPLAPGIYRVVWRVVSRDTHRTNGTFPFRVEP